MHLRGLAGCVVATGLAVSMAATSAHGQEVPGEVVPLDSRAWSPILGPGAYGRVPGGAPHVTAFVSDEPCLFYTHADAAWDIQVIRPGS